jgi:hypothetical protein
MLPLLRFKTIEFPVPDIVTNDDWNNRGAGMWAQKGRLSVDM